MTAKAKHRCWTPAECTRERPHRHSADNCPVCDWGLGICKDCGRAEIELDEPCDFRNVDWEKVRESAEP